MRVAIEQAVAGVPGVSQRTAERSVKDQIKHPKPAPAEKLESEVRCRWQPLVGGAGASEVELRQIAADGLGEVYFRDSGSRTDGLQVEFTDIDYIDVAL
ncbi:hypothetical protein ACFCZ1_22165 [Streptomyces sp. NPDC056224]|uniref:hypothetical protein n=1 Tax=Streptomyces sp. NPDC056224 TaxID=3345750 RepID=UPI0035DF4C22